MVGLITEQYPPYERNGRGDEILARLAEIDRLSTKPRTVRELRLNKQAARDYIQALDTEAGALRVELAAL